MLLHICEVCDDGRLWEIWGLQKTHGDTVACHRLVNYLKEDGFWTGGWLMLGMICFVVGRMEEARNYMERARDLEPDLALVHELLSLCASHMGWFEEARWYAERALELDPYNRRCRSILSGILMRQGEINLAVHTQELAFIHPKKTPLPANDEVEQGSLLASN